MQIPEIIPDQDNQFSSPIEQSKCNKSSQNPGLTIIFTFSDLFLSFSSMKLQFVFSLQDLYLVFFPFLTNENETVAKPH